MIFQRPGQTLHIWRVEHGPTYDENQMIDGDQITAWCLLCDLEYHCA